MSGYGHYPYNNIMIGFESILGSIYICCYKYSCLSTSNVIERLFTRLTLFSVERYSKVVFGFDKRKTLMSAATASPFPNSNVPLTFRVQENPYGDHEIWNQIY
jgi:hypothetical protein